MLLHVKTKLLSENGRLPTRSYPTDAGADLYAAENVFIPKGQTVTVKTDIALDIPEDHVVKIESRSGLAAKGIFATAGVVDASYTGNIGVVLNNFSNNSGVYNGQEGYQITKGDRIAQILIYKVETPSFKVTEELSTKRRGSNGYGSSGI